MTGGAGAAGPAGAGGVGGAAAAGAAGAAGCALVEWHKNWCRSPEWVDLSPNFDDTFCANK